MSRPELVELWMEWRFSEPMPGGGDAVEEAAILERMRGRGLTVPIEHGGVVFGNAEPCELRLLEDGRVMRVRFDLSDVVMPSSVRLRPDRTDGYEDDPRGGGDG